MSASSLVIYPSRQRQYGLWLLPLAVLLVYISVPLPDLWLWGSAPLLLAFFYYWLQAINLPVYYQAVILDSDGSINWKTTNGFEHGHLLPDGLTGQLLIRVSWQDSGGNSRSCWLLADQLSEADFHTLARHVQQASWQRTVR